MRHFDDEEKLLLPLLSDDNDLKVRTLEEHQAIRTLVRKISEDPQHDAVLVLSTLVNDHIRFEERVLFPYLEQTLSQDQLNQIGKQLNNHPEFCDSWSQDFWRP